VLEPRKLWPSGVGRKGRIVGLAPGRALAFADDPAWSAVTAELTGPDAEPSAELCDGLVGVLRAWAGQWDSRPVAVVPMPSRSRPRRVTGMAAHIATVGRLPVVDALRAQGSAPAGDTASAARVSALLEGLRVADSVGLPTGPVLLVDDFSRTGWTLTVAAALLRDAGAGAILPLVGHRRP
jgi:ATP-dependent DNA helicase RecQ